MTPLYKYNDCHIWWTKYGYVARTYFIIPIPTGYFETLSQVCTWIDKR